jgi:hypothetical protein
MKYCQDAGVSNHQVSIGEIDAWIADIQDALASSAPVSTPVLVDMAIGIISQQRELTPEEQASLNAYYKKVYRPLPAPPVDIARESFVKGLHEGLRQSKTIPSEVEAGLNRLIDNMREENAQLRESLRWAMDFINEGDDGPLEPNQLCGQCGGLGKCLPDCPWAKASKLVEKL